ncbi:hypothetical protein IOD13_09040 [Brevibacterium casei]|nr:hypothetical protein [Brevibacterium casei]
MDRLAQEVGETCHLMVRTGGTVRVLVSSPGGLEPRVGSRENAVLPAATTSGGLARWRRCPTSGSSGSSTSSRRGVRHR